MKPVWINGQKVDWQRSELTTGAQTSSIEPKVLAVLQVLVQANGNVVSQQMILDTVWGNVVVAPNALQRCIAQLRKLFSDDAKTQGVIKTHPKKGYSLVATISLSAPVAHINKPVENTPLNIKSSQITKFAVFTLFGILIMLFIGYYFITSRDNQVAEYRTITPLTSSDSIESMPALSADKQMLAYINTQANDEFGDNAQLIIKNLITQKESVLLTNTRFRNGISFSPDNQKISYSETVLIDNTKCAQIMQVALKSKQRKQLTPCKNNFYHSPQWLNSTHLIALKTDKLGNGEFIIFDTSANQQTQLVSKFKSPISFAYNPNSKQIAVISQSDNDKLLLSFAKLNQQESKVITTQSFPLPFNFDSQLQPKWFDENKLLIANNQKIHWFDDTGLIQTTGILTPDTIFSAQTLNNKGDILTVLGNQDMDARLRTWPSNNANSFSDQVIQRSTKIEYAAKFQPNTNNLALISNRTGQSQIWLNEEQNLEQLTHIQGDKISTFVWSPTDNQLAFLANQTIWIKTLGQAETAIKLNFKVIDIYQWWQNQETDYLLLNALLFNKTSNKAEPYIILLNLDKLTFTKEFSGKNYWAQKVSNNSLIMTDHLGHIFKFTDNQKQTITDLDHITVQWRFYWRNGM